MKFTIILGISLAMIGYSCLQTTSKNNQQKNGDLNLVNNSKIGLLIEYGPNLETTHIDDQGISNFYVHSTAVIPNHIRLVLSISNIHIGD